MTRHRPRHETTWKYLTNFTSANYAEAMRVLRYLRGTAAFGLVMNVHESSRLSLVGFYDADYANDPDDYKSVSGYVTILDGNAVSYSSRTQPINAQSTCTCEAEYIAMNDCTRDLLWFEDRLDELH
jgi:hypothetical protein